VPLESLLALSLAGGFFAFVLVSVLLTRLNLVTTTAREKPLTLPRFVGTASVFLPMALFEEFIFRWLMIGQLYRWIGLAPAFLLSIAAFAAVHRPNGKLGFVSVLNLTIVGAIFGFVYLHWGLWVVSAAHAGWNLAQWGLGYAVSGQKTRQILPSPIFREVQDEPFGPEGHWTATLVLLAALAILLATHNPRP
jgi:membrane protease YdiL (CAAX protease family)